MSQLIERGVSCLLGAESSVPLPDALSVCWWSRWRPCVTLPPSGAQAAEMPNAELLEAATFGNLGAVKGLLAEGANVNEKQRTVSEGALQRGCGWYIF